MPTVVKSTWGFLLFLTFCFLRVFFFVKEFNMNENHPSSKAEGVEMQFAGAVVDAPPMHATPGLTVYVSEYCPFCARVKKLFASIGVAPTYIDITNEANKSAYVEAAKAYEYDSVPMVIYKDRLLGGCDSMCVALETGLLPRLLDLPSLHAVVRPGEARPDLVSPGLFAFPPLVNIITVRGTSFLTMVISIILIVWRDEPWAWWVTFGMTVDFLARLMFGGTASVLGSVSNLFFFWKEEELVPGPPKQFAAAVGLLIYGLATILALAGDGNKATWIGAPICMGIIAFFAFLEAGFNFCAGCYVFSLLNKWGVIENTIYQPYTDSYHFLSYGVREMNTKVGWVEGGLTDLQDEHGAVANNHTAVSWRKNVMDLDSNRMNGSALPRPIRVAVVRDPAKDPIMDTDIHYKFPKVEESHREAWGFKYVHFPDFSMVLGIGGMAWVLKFADKVFDTPSNAWKVISVLTAIVFGLLLIALLAKSFFYPKRIFMDFQHPARRNAAAMIPIGFLICSGLAEDVDHHLQLALWWMGAPLSALSMVFTIIYYLRNRQMGGTYNPTVMVPILAHFVASMTAVMLVKNQSAEFTANYMEAANWFFGVGVLFGAFTMAGTMYHGVFFHWAVDRARGSISIWMGSCFICCIAYNIVFSLASFDIFSFTLYSGGVVLYLAMLYLIYPGRWLLVGYFEPTHWGLGFPLHTFAIASFQYYQSQGHAFSLGMCWVSMVSCTFATVCFFSHSVTKLLKRQWPGPCVEGSPLAFNHFVHEALREVAVRLRHELQVSEPSHPEMTARSQVRLKELAGEFLRVLRVNQIIKRAYVFPELKSVSKEHVRIGDDMSAKVQLICSQAEAYLKDDDVESLGKYLSGGVLDECSKCIDWQEDHLPPIIHKGINTRIAAIIMERTWEFVDLEDLEHMVSFTFRYLPKQMQRVKFIKGLTGTLPERCQQIGLWLYRGALLDPLGDIKFTMLIDVAPEVIPRGLGIRWTRQL